MKEPMYLRKLDIFYMILGCTKDSKITEKNCGWLSELGCWTKGWVWNEPALWKLTIPKLVELYKKIKQEQKWNTLKKLKSAKNSKKSKMAQSIDLDYYLALERNSRKQLD